MNTQPDHEPPAKIAKLFKPPYYAVVFTATRNDIDDEGYGKTACRMMELAQQQDGFLGVDSVRDDSSVGITVSYWRDTESIRKWHQVLEHQQAQEKGRSTWYKNFSLRVCLVEREYDFES